MKIIKKIKQIMNILAIVMCGFFLFGSKVDATGQKLVKIVFVGNQNSGKTAFRSRLSNKHFDFDTQIHTRHTDVYTQLVQYDQHTTLACELYDTSGLPKVKDQILSYRAKDANFIVITIDLSADAIEDCEDIVEQNVATWVQAIRQKQSSAHLIFVGTKMDKLSVSKRQYFENKLNIWSQAYRKGHHLIVSSKENTNINNFFEIVKQAIRTDGSINSLPDWEEMRDCKGEPDDSDKGWCVIV